MRVEVSSRRWMIEWEQKVLALELKMDGQRGVEGREAGASSVVGVVGRGGPG